MSALRLGIALIWATFSGSVEAADGGMTAEPGAPKSSAKDAVGAEGREVLGRPFEQQSNLAIRKKLLACTKVEPSNADCWRYLAVAYARGSRLNNADEAKGATAFKRFIELHPPGVKGDVEPICTWTRSEAAGDNDGGEPGQASGCRRALDVRD